MRNIELDVHPETPEEKEIETYLTILHTSPEMKSFMDKMQNYANDHNIFKYKSRIKDIHSAIRTYRINHKSLSEVSDYIGFTFIVNTEDDIQPIVEYLHTQLSNANDINFLAEDSVYSPLTWMKWVPPLTYNLFAKEPLIPNVKPVPIEIRICSKEGFVAEQSAYYSVHKNGHTGLELNVKQNLKDVTQHLAYKLAIIGNRNLSEKEMKQEIRKLHELLNSQRVFLLSNWKLIEEAIIDCGMLIYKIQNDKSISADDQTLSKEDMLKIEDEIKKIFWNHFEKVNEEDYFSMNPDGTYKADLGKAFLNTSKFMQSIPYQNIKEKALKKTTY